MNGDGRGDGRGDGHLARDPREIPRGGWKDVLSRVKDEVKDDQLGLLSAGTAFYAFLAIFPGIIAAVSLYGLIASPQQIQQQLQSISGVLPAGVTQLLTRQISQAAGGSSTALTWGLALSLAAALWAASTGVKGLMNALNRVYEEDESRGFVAVRGTALALTLGAIVLVVVLVGLIAGVPAVIARAGLGGTVETVMNWGRWPLLAAAMALAVGVLYRVAPDRDDARWRWVTPGSLLATVLWLGGSAAFSWYVASYGSYNQTYGNLASVVVLLLWLFISAFAVLLGAELNSELELHTRHDTTVGDPQPLGERGAYVADTPPRQREEERSRR